MPKHSRRYTPDSEDACIASAHRLSVALVILEHHNCLAKPGAVDNYEGYDMGCLAEILREVRQELREPPRMGRAVTSS